MKVKPQQFLSCDWGTSTFRLKLIEGESLKVFAKEERTEGILKTFELWKQTGKEEDQRFQFYQSILQEKIKKLEELIKSSLSGVPLIISGMATSSIGMVELPYKELPFSLDGHDLFIKKIDATKKFPHPLLFISGAKNDSDVMRGEETQLIGCTSSGEDEVFIFPGTHSKHVFVKNNKARDFKTFMTGEFFELLSKRSILSSSVEEAKEPDKLLQDAFEKGVFKGVKTNLLHACFLVRTNQIFGKLSKEENLQYLSGLLIGGELKDLANKKYNSVTLIGNKVLEAYYEKAILLAGIAKQVKLQDAEEAMIRGQLKVFAHEKKGK